jgi:hypothetical protein
MLDRISRMSGADNERLAYEISYDNKYALPDKALPDTEQFPLTAAFKAPAGVPAAATLKSKMLRLMGDQLVCSMLPPDETGLEPLFATIGTDAEADARALSSCVGKVIQVRLQPNHAALSAQPATAAPPPVLSAKILAAYRGSPQTKTRFGLSDCSVFAKCLRSVCEVFVQCLCSDSKAISKQLRNVCAAITKRLCSDSKASSKGSNRRLRSDGAVFAQRFHKDCISSKAISKQLRSVCAAITKRLCSDSKAISKRWRSVCAAMAQCLRSDSKASSKGVLSVCSAMAQRLRSVCAAFAQRFRREYSAFAQRWLSDCAAFAQ